MAAAGAEGAGPELPPRPRGAQVLALRSLQERFANVATDKNFPLDTACLLRYLRARDYDIDAAEEMLKDTLNFRREYQVGDIPVKFQRQLRRENATGKTYARGFDKRGRVVLYMKPRYENTNDHDGNIVHLIYNMERACAMQRTAGTGVEKFALVVDYLDYSLSNAPPMKTSRLTLDILQSHYPERLGVAYLLNPPWIFRAAWAAISPFIDPVTYEKIQFVVGDAEAQLGLLRENFDLDELEVDVGGRNRVPFNSKIYIESELGEDIEKILRKPNEEDAADGAGSGSAGPQSHGAWSPRAAEGASFGTVFKLPNLRSSREEGACIAFEGVVVICIALAVALFMTGRLEDALGLVVGSRLLDSS